MTIALDRLSDLVLFTRIVQNGSLTAAAREMNISLPVVSARLAHIEKQLGVTLLNRSTRTMSLTEDGNEFLLRAQKILRDVSDLEDLLSGRSKEPKGRLRVTASRGFTRRHIAPRLAKFHALYPDVMLDLIATDEVVDLIHDGVDLAIRQMTLPDSSLKVRVIAANQRIACASPDYLKQHQRPLSPADLVSHNCIVIGDPPMTRWAFVKAPLAPAGAVSGPGKEQHSTQVVEVPYICQTNDGDVAHSAALNGAGVVLKSMVDVADDLAAGRLINLFPDWQSPWAPIQAVYPARRHPCDKVNLFIDFLTDELALVT